MCNFQRLINVVVEMQLNVVKKLKFIATADCTGQRTSRVIVIMLNVHPARDGTFSIVFLYQSSYLHQKYGYIIFSGISA